VRPAVLALLLVAALASAAAKPAFKAGVFEPPHAAPELGLAGSDGRPLALARFRGRVVALAFGFTTCPDVCPVTLGTLAEARRKLGADAAGFQVVYVTVDPERDDAERMRTYLASFDASFVGGTGAPEELAAVRAAYGVLAEKVVNPAGYGVVHSSSIYLIDRAGRLRALMPYGRPADEFVHDVRLLLAE
jgi:protein SCO1/2